jgi:hypothetical protein
MQSKFQEMLLKLLKKCLDTFISIYGPIMKYDFFTDEVREEFLEIFKLLKKAELRKMLKLFLKSKIRAKLPELQNFLLD